MCKHLSITSQYISYRKFFQQALSDDGEQLVEGDHVITSPPTGNQLLSIKDE